MVQEEGGGTVYQVNKLHILQSFSSCWDFSPQFIFKSMQEMKE